LLLNATSDHASGSANDWNILVDTVGNLNVTVNGVSQSLGAVTNAVDYLVLGRIVTGSDGKFDLWLSPDLNAVASLDDFLSSVAPLFSYSGGGALADITSLGLSAYRGTGSSSVMRLDSLRLSDGNSNAATAFGDATGITAIPEPTALAGLFG